MRFHSIASFILRRHRAVIPAADLAVSPAQCRYLEQERRIRRQIFICRILFLVLFLFSWETAPGSGFLNDFIFSPRPGCSPVFFPWRQTGRSFTTRESRFWRRF